jgi:hypothetical protein
MRDFKSQISDLRQIPATIKANKSFIFKYKKAPTNQ